PLAHDADPGVREATVFLIAACGTRYALPLPPLLRARPAAETDPEVRAGVVTALALLDAGDGAWRYGLLADPEPWVRLATAEDLLRTAEPPLPGDVAEHCARAYAADPRPGARGWCPRPGPCGHSRWERPCPSVRHPVETLTEMGRVPRFAVAPLRERPSRRDGSSRTSCTATPCTRTPSYGTPCGGCWRRRRSSAEAPGEDTGRGRCDEAPRGGDFAPSCALGGVQAVREGSGPRSSRA
ncbi:MAG TPA: HEAT repeat domain-containing protein, partial [Streptomyces sp.]|nr:HEAT repeat domain-containing protein [Streptomyces sp.]